MMKQEPPGSYPTEIPFGSLTGYRFGSEEPGV